MQKFDDISVSLKGNLAFVEIHRPPNNFFDAFLIQQIADAYEALDEEDLCRVIILKSEGKNFCAEQILEKIKICSISLYPIRSCMLRQ